MTNSLLPLTPEQCPRCRRRLVNLYGGLCAWCEGEYTAFAPHLLRYIGSRRVALRPLPPLGQWTRDVVKRRDGWLRLRAEARRRRA